MPNTKLRYPPEFLAKAVRSLRSSDKSIPKIATDPAISDRSLGNRCCQANINSGDRHGFIVDLSPCASMWKQTEKEGREPR